MDQRLYETAASDDKIHRGTPVLKRVIGGACGAFVLGFLACIVYAYCLVHLGEKLANYAALVGVILGAVGGSVFPRVGHFSAYCFILFLNLTLSFVVGETLEERLTFFLIFGFVECMFLVSKWLMKK